MVGSCYFVVVAFFLLSCSCAPYGVIALKLNRQLANYILKDGGPKRFQRLKGVDDALDAFLDHNVDTAFTFDEIVDAFAAQERELASQEMLQFPEPVQIEPEKGVYGEDPTEFVRHIYTEAYEYLHGVHEGDDD